MNHEELAVLASSDRPLRGTVVAVQANFYRVRLEIASEIVHLLCTRRTRLKKIGQQVMVGDLVVVEEPDWQDFRGAIAAVMPRSTELQRPNIANAQRILLLFAVEEPTLDPWQLTRFLLKAESTSLELSLCLNKCDLISDKQRQQWQQRIENWGYNPILLSVKHNLGIDALLNNLKHTITIVAGPSGVGKSSLIDALIPSVNLRIGEVSGKLQRGRHTTRHVELFELPKGGLLADSPGFNQPDLNYAPANLAQYFPEIRARLQQGSCQFNNCLHRNEPNCVVRGDWERYEYYLDFLDKAIAYSETQQQTRDRESSLKLKVKASGKVHYIPKLETKKYRRTSRKEKHQNLQDVYEKQLLQDIQDETEDF